MINRTLSQQLFLRIVPAMLLSILMVGAAAFYSAYAEINDEYDDQLVSNANMLWVLFRDELREQREQGSNIDAQDLEYAAPDLPQQEGGDYSQARMFRVWHKGHILFHSDTGLPKEVAQAPETGFSIVRYNGERWRIYHMEVKDEGSAVEVGEKIGLRIGIATDIMFDLALPLLVMLPVAGFMIWLGIGNGLQPIRMLVRQIRMRSADDMAPVIAERLPRDILPLLDSLNHLLVRLERTLTAEKRFADNAAHQLRTPLAALNLNLQMLSTCDDPAERQALILALKASNERASTLIGNLLTMARLSHQAIQLGPIDLQQATASVMADIGALAMARHIEMSLLAEHENIVQADETLLRLILSNLIENAVKYTPTGGFIEVVLTLEKETGYSMLAITDNGPGIPEDEREKVFHRFYRIDMPQEEGSGIGLAIVAEALDRLRGSISLLTPTSGIGLRVELRLPLAMPTVT